jgi:hypothetical protein
MARIDQPTTDRIDQQVSYRIDYNPLSLIKPLATLGLVTKGQQQLPAHVTKPNPVPTHITA